MGGHLSNFPDVPGISQKSVHFRDIYRTFFAILIYIFPETFQEFYKFRLTISENVLKKPPIVHKNSQKVHHARVRARWTTKARPGASATSSPCNRFRNSPFQDRKFP